MRLATILTQAGPRLHVRGESGYVDAAAETVEQSMRNRGARPGSANSRAATDSSSADPVTMVKTTSRPARSDGSSTSSAPVRATASALPGVRFHTARGTPARARRSGGKGRLAMGRAADGAQCPGEGNAPRIGPGGCGGLADQVPQALVDRENRPDLLEHPVGELGVDHMA